MTVCGGLIDNQKTARSDRIKALIARAGVFTRRNQIDRAIADYDAVVWLDASLAEVYNSRGELWRKTGDRRKALADFDAALKRNPDFIAARSNYKDLVLELERLGALMAVYNKPGFNCAKARRAVEKAICADPTLANLDREITAVNAKVIERARAGNPPAGRALQREQDAFVARRNAAFGQADFDLLKAMRARLDQLLAIERRM
jgi:tetratricopeptide (TPR) repeat protein